MINIRHPGLKWNGCDLESEPDEDEHGAERGRVIVDLAAGERRRDALQIRFARYTEDPGDSVNKKRGRKRAENQIFYARFKSDRAAPGKTNEHEKRNGDELERDKDENEIDGRNEKHQPAAGENRQ